MEKETLEPRELTHMTKVIMRKENGKQIIHFYEKDPKETLKGQMSHIYPSCECHHIEHADNHYRGEKTHHIFSKRKYISHTSLCLCRQKTLRYDIF